MTRRDFLVPALALALVALALVGCATQTRSPGMPPELAQRVRQIGPVINPPETAKLYAPLQPAPKPGEAEITRDLAYGPDARHRLDVFSPPSASSGARRPVLVFVHGGGFVAGNKTAPGSPFYDNIMRWATGKGMVGVNVTYRLAPQYPWPAGRDDLGAALAWIGRNVGRFGGDPARITLVGHSAGATHVASVVADPASIAAARAAGARVESAAMISGVYDLSTFPGGPAPVAYFGSDRMLYPQRSPMNGLLATDVRLMLAHAELDPPEFRVQQQAMAQALCGRGRCPVTLDQPGHSHMSEIYAIGTDDRVLADALAAFVAGAAAGR